jgi:hypothetical protein
MEVLDMEVPVVLGQDIMGHMDTIIIAHGIIIGINGGVGDFCSTHFKLIR